LPAAGVAPQAVFAGTHGSPIRHTRGPLMSSSTKVEDPAKIVWGKRLMWKPPRAMSAACLGSCLRRKDGLVAVSLASVSWVGYGD
jgi:hypothetical protein